jgi:non-ribosomal peptide synthetase component F
MIRLAVRKVKPEEENRLREWMAELNRRAAEVRQTFASEGVRHEQACLLTTSDGPILIYAVEAEDLDRAAAAYASSIHPIDQEHRRVMQQALAEPASVELLYECRAA